VVKITNNPAKMISSEAGIAIFPSDTHHFGVERTI